MTTREWKENDVFLELKLEWNNLIASDERKSVGFRIGGIGEIFFSTGGSLRRRKRGRRKRGRRKRATRQPETHLEIASENAPVVFFHFSRPRRGDQKRALRIKGKPWQGILTEGERSVRLTSLHYTGSDQLLIILKKIFSFLQNKLS